MIRIILIIMACLTSVSVAQLLIDGKSRISAVSDDFESAGWNFIYDGHRGNSANGKWGSSFRGAPEVLQRVGTPSGGIPGSQYSLRIRSYDFNDPGDNYPQQEDFNSKIASIVGLTPASREPLITVRVHLPNFNTWPINTRCFGLRTDARTSSGSAYYPTLSLANNSAGSKRFLVRLGAGSPFTQEYDAGAISSAGWWTLGIGFDSSGITRFYARAGTGDLRPSDELLNSQSFNVSGQQAPRISQFYNTFISISYPSSPSLSPDFIIDNYDIYENAPPISNGNIQIGKLSANQGSSSSWRTVTFPNPYSVVPVVVMGALSFDGGNPATLRVRNISETSFQFQIDEWDYLDGSHTNEKINWMAIEPGQYSVDGRIWEAGLVSGVNHSWRTHGFETDFEGGGHVVLTQVASHAGPSAVTVRTRNVGESSFQLRVQEEEGNDGLHAGEDVCYIAISEGKGSINGKKYQAKQTGNEVTGAFKTITFDETISNDRAFFASIMTFDGGDACAIRRDQFTTTSIKIRCEEEKSKDNETGHTTEKVGWFVIQL